MGVPAFYRWLSEKYPKIVQDVLEDRVHLAGPDSSIRLPFDSTRPNPSGLECDNLYIDMNGIIHPCSHPEVGPQPQTEEEMYENVCRYVDRLFRITRPRKLLYLAIDGVAPRAKMNQQRARRFRSAQEARELKELETHIRDELVAVGEQAPPRKATDPWDSNVITPGTPFMLRLADYVRFYVRKRISTDKAWQSIKVIFSDASVPGEGEHKIMAHVRLQRAQPGYNPNLVHVLHGLDADLIMLALATHEAHFYISREEVTFGRKSMETQERRQMESGFLDRQKALDEAAGAHAMQGILDNQGKPIQRISIPILREYLAHEFAPLLDPARLPFAPSLERLLDDVVFLCFFVGNDFLPHLPSLDIRDGALDYLFNVYQRVLPGLGSYLTRSGGNVNLSHVDVILAEVGAIEDHVFAMKHDNETREKERRARFAPRNRSNPPQPPPVPPPPAQGRSARILAKAEEGKAVALQRGHRAKEESRQQTKARHMMADDNDAAAQALKASLVGAHVMDEEKQESDIAPRTEQPKEGVRLNDNIVVVEEEKATTDAKESSNVKRKLDEVGEKDDVSEKAVQVKPDPGQVGDMEEEFEDDAGEDDDVEDDRDEDAARIDDIIVEVDPAVAKAFKEKVKAEQQKKLDEYSNSIEDKVRLHESGWKDRYYTDKCKADDVEAHGGREHLFRSYVMGLCWVMKYYYDGCPSWKWYYPFHYGPFASDLRNIERFEKDVRAFELATPFNPVEQLMAVLPSDSAHAIPKAARWLMTDPESPILDFYPGEVPVDPNGKAMPWLWVVLLPFIEEDRLLGAMSPTMTKWTKEELLCNARGLDDGYLFVHRSHPLSKKLASVLSGGKTAKAPKVKLIDSATYDAGFSGSVRPPLINELYPVDEDAEINPPPSADRISESQDGLFSDSIKPNDAICVAFSEPLKLSHKSVLLPGARLSPPQLSIDDKRIRRPRLNRGGGSIANLGVSNGQSHQSGYGSMNIGSYERNLAQRTGRGQQMNQAGTRAWGAMEPQQKRQRPGPPPPQMPNPFLNQGHLHQVQGREAYSNRPPWQQNHPSTSNYTPPSAQYPQGGQRTTQNFAHQNGYPQHYSQSQGVHTQRFQHVNGRGQQPPAPGGYQSQQRGGYSSFSGGNRSGYNVSQQGGHRGPHHPQQQQEFSFRQTDQGPPSRGPPEPQRSRASSNVMNSLRAQLSNTLQRNNKSGPKR